MAACNFDNFNNGAGTGAPTFSNGANIVGGALSGTFTGSPTLSGNPTFSGTPVFSSGITQVSTINTSNTAVTLTSASNRLQTFTGFTASTIVTLPTTGIVAGEIWTLSVTGSTALMVLNSSGGNTITQISAGTVRVQALVNTPTTAANWLIVEVSCVEYLSNSSTSSASDSTSFQYGTAGNTVITGSPGGTGITKRIRAICPFQPTDVCTVEFLAGTNATGCWMALESYDQVATVQAYVTQATAGYGLGIQGPFINTTDIAVVFGTYSYASSSVYDNTGVTWATTMGFWRVKKYRSS